jgi:hypothetical protein
MQLYQELIDKHKNYIIYYLVKFVKNNDLIF